MKSTYFVNELQDLYKTGIYKITCLSNLKVYIGSACSTKDPSKSKRGFHVRWENHIRELTKNVHKNKPLQNAWNKYGEENFIFEILEFCNSIEAVEKEVFYIDLYDTINKEKGFNVLRGNLSNYNLPSEEHKQKLSNLYKGKKRPLELVKKWSNEVQQIDKSGNIIATYYSMCEAERKTGIMRQDIGQACIGIKIKRAGGFFWKKVKDIV